MRKIMYLVFFCSVLQHIAVHAQEGEPQLPTIVPPSPTAYELGRFGEIPIGLFTGTPNVGVPICDFSVGNLSIPIALDYSSNGIKVDQLATHVGLGWNLLAGGVITRTAHGGADEERGDTHQRPSEDNNDYRSDPWLNYFQSVVKYTGALPTSMDSEPDLFTFNFLGQTGKFTLDRDKKVLPLDNTPHQITLDLTTKHFTIIDGQGNTYYFEDTERSLLQSTGPGGLQQGREMITSWFLSRIETPTNHTIYFTYEDEDYLYKNTLSETATAFTSANPDVQPACSNDRPNPPTLSGIRTHYLTLTGKRLQRISSNKAITGSIVFSYGQAHPEVENYELLTEIKKLNSEQQTIREATLAYTNQNDRLFLESVAFRAPNHRYAFQYHNLTSVPKRLHMAKDHWGYYNGKRNTSLIPKLPISDYHKVVFFKEFFPNTADKSVDVSRAKAGLLKRITYPTKGYSELSYEGNDYNTTEKIEKEASASLSVKTKFTQQNDQDELIISNVARTGYYKLMFLGGYNYQHCRPEQFPAEADKKIFFRIENRTNTQDDIIYIDNIYGPKLGRGVLRVFRGRVDDGVYVRLLEGNTYRLRLDINYRCLYGDLSFEYAVGEQQTIRVNKPLGGLRIATLANYDKDGTPITAKTYQYASLETPDRSSGHQGKTPEYFSRSYASGSCSNPPNPFCIGWVIPYDVLNSGNLRSLYETATQNTRYEHVVVREMEGTTPNGGTVYRFKRALPDNDGRRIHGAYDRNLPNMYTDWGDGLELEKSYFKEEDETPIILQKEINTYARDNRFNTYAIGYRVGIKYIEHCKINPTLENIIVDTYDVSQYKLKGHWYYKDSKTTLTYDAKGENPVTQLEKYFYGNAQHTQLTRTETTDSQGNTYVQTVDYPQDLTAPTDVETKLINQHHITTPIDTRRYYKEGTTSHLLSSSYQVYQDWAGILRLDTIKVAKATHDYSSTAVYHRYDSYGNPLEVSKADGAFIIYIWGYHHTYPVAKIENATYTEVNSYINAIHTASNADTDRTIGTMGKEGELRTALQALRTGLPEALVTTYTYDPQIGVTSVTDPKGETSYYHYDAYHRLQYVKDADGHLISKNTYHYTTN